MINRPIYLKALIVAQHNGFPKVITGVRRCGKSYLLKEIYYSYNLVDEAFMDDSAKYIILFF